MAEELPGVIHESMANSFEETIDVDIDVKTDPVLKEMKPALAVDEMFPEGGAGYIDLEESGGSTGLLMDLASNEKNVHADFYNDFEDMFDEDEFTLNGD